MCPARAEYVRREMFSTHYLHLFRRYTPPLKVASDSWVCVKERFVSFSSLSPFGGSGAYRINDSPHSPFFVFRHSSFSPFFVILPPSTYGLRPITSSFFFRLETLFLPFFASLYYAIIQLLTHPFYTNRPSFVHHSYILSIS